MFCATPSIWLIIKKQEWPPPHGNFPFAPKTLPNKWRTINSPVHKNSTYTVDEAKERLNPSRAKR